MIEIKKQQVTEELQHIEDRIKRNFDNRIIIKPDIESGEPEIPDAEEQLEEVFAESQIVNASVNKNSKDVELNENDTQHVELANEPSDSNFINNTAEETGSIIKDDVNGEQESKCQEDIFISEIHNETVVNNDSVKEKIEPVLEIWEEKTQK